jgi:membrane protease YdiL (CAAX protease family)
MTIQPTKGEISWKASFGWTWIVAQLVWILICTKLLLAVVQFIPSFGKWLIAHPVFYNATVWILTDIWLLWAAFLCSKSKSVQDFIQGAALNRRPTLKELLFVLAAIGLGFLSIFGNAKGLTGGNWVAEVFHNQGGAAWSFYVIYGRFISPFAEEVAERGFLYRAFRGNYGMPLSIALIVCWDIFGHWPMASHSLFSFCNYGLLAILFCIVREKTGSIWNCILCHMVYNAIVIQQWSICIIAILIFLFVASKNKTKQQLFVRQEIS